MQTTVSIAHEDLILSAHKAVYWPKQSLLVLADVHLGKAGHFRKNGIALPADIAKNDLLRLHELIHLYQPENVLFLGDLFHAAPNMEWNWFFDWLKNYPKIHFQLVLGNHDRDLQRHPVNRHVDVSHEKTIGPFLFTHEPLTTPHASLYNVCGHIHPGIQLSGKGRQRLKLPCFWFGEQQGILPAFGNLTGAVALKGKARVFAIGHNQLFEM